jgi:hypothetical protein
MVQSSENMPQNMLDVTSFLEEVNSSYLPKEIIQTTKLSDLPQKHKYTIKSINRLTTKYGEKLLMDISVMMLNQNVEYSVFQPDRFEKICLRHKLTYL